MVPNTSEDLPEPETPVNTVSRRLGSSTLTSLRLFSRAPWTRIRSCLPADCGLEEAVLMILSSSSGVHEGSGELLPRHRAAYGDTNRYMPLNQSKKSGGSGK